MIETSIPNPNSAPKNIYGTEKRNISYDIVIYLKENDAVTRRIALTFSKLLITTGCLMVIDPENEVPCEVHCYSMSSVDRFIFDNKALVDGNVIFK